MRRRGSQYNTAREQTVGLYVLHSYTHLMVFTFSRLPYLTDEGGCIPACLRPVLILKKAGRFATLVSPDSVY
jgi:hypothetical protein